MLNNKELIKNLKETIKKKMLDSEGYCMNNFAIWFINIILDNVKYINEVKDYGYDISIYPKEIEESYDLSEYETIEDFLTKELTGQTIATYISGAGITTETYMEEASRKVSDLWYDFILKEFPEVELKKDNWIDDTVYDNLTNENLSNMDLLIYICNLNIKNFYNQYLIKALEFRNSQEVEHEIKKQKFLQHKLEMESLSLETLPLITKFDKGIKFEKNNYKELINFLDKLIKKYGKEKVYAALFLHKFNLSNSVKNDLNKLYEGKIFNKEIYN